MSQVYCDVHGPSPASSFVEPETMQFYLKCTRCHENQDFIMKELVAHQERIDACAHLRIEALPHNFGVLCKDCGAIGFDKE